MDEEMSKSFNRLNEMAGKWTKAVAAGLYDEDKRAVDEIVDQFIQSLDSAAQ